MSIREAHLSPNFTPKFCLKWIETPTPLPTVWLQPIILKIPILPSPNLEPIRPSWHVLFSYNCKMFDNRGTLLDMLRHESGMPCGKSLMCRCCFFTKNHTSRCLCMCCFTYSCQCPIYCCSVVKVYWIQGTSNTYSFQFTVLWITLFVFLA